MITIQFSRAGGGGGGASGGRRWAAASIAQARQTYSDETYRARGLAQMARGSTDAGSKADYLRMRSEALAKAAQARRFFAPAK